MEGNNFNFNTFLDDFEQKPGPTGKGVPRCSSFQSFARDC
jgi:hypothetical protein